MIQVEASIWNQIAKLGGLRTDWARKTFPLGQEAQLTEYEAEERSLRDQGYDPTLAQAFLTMKPLLLENEAISRLMLQRQIPNLRQALPEITSINQACLLATQEFRLSQSQMEKLQGLLAEAASQRE